MAYEVTTIGALGAPSDVPAPERAPSPVDGPALAAVTLASVLVGAGIIWFWRRGRR